MRQLVKLRAIHQLHPIEGADAIECVTIDGWTVVVKKGEFKPGDLCVYFEIDSFLPESDERYAFLMKGGVRTMDGVRGHKLRTVKLRGQLSQGLVLPLTSFPEIQDKMREYGDQLPGEFPPSAWWTHVSQFDYSDVIGVKKWEMPISAQLAGLVKGDFPSFIRKTDQERCQNLVKEIFADTTAKYEVTVKLDGTSFTGYHNQGVNGVCQRNLELKLDDENKDNAYVKVFNETGLAHALTVLGCNIAVQGELMGPGIQKNREGLKVVQLFVFDIYDIDAGRYLPPAERFDLLEILHALCLQAGAGIQYVPIVAHSANLLDTLGISTIDQLLKFAEGKSINHDVREGLVFKRLDGEFSFKAISNAFLLKEKD